MIEYKPIETAQELVTLIEADLVYMVPIDCVEDPMGHFKQISSQSIGDTSFKTMMSMLKNKQFFQVRERVIVKKEPINTDPISLDRFKIKEL